MVTYLVSLTYIATVKFHRQKMHAASISLYVMEQRKTISMCNFTKQGKVLGKSALQTDQFIHIVKYIEILPPQKQLILFSATSFHRETSYSYPI